MNRSALWLLLIWLWVPLWSMAVEDNAPSAEAVSHIAIAIGKSNLYKYSKPITRVSVADPTIADVVVLNPTQIYLLGKKAGSTNVFLWHSQSAVTPLEVSVGVDTLALQDLLKRLMPGENNIRAMAAGESLVLTGQVADAIKVQQAVQIASEYTGKKVLNMLTTQNLPQVLVEVKIAEVDKSVSDALGIQLQGSNFSFNMLNTTTPLGFSANASVLSGNTNSWIQAQISNGLIKILAEPNIVAISGQEGEFLSGGIIFLPVPQSSGTGGAAVITLQPQNYGVGVKFTPTVLGEGRINLKVSPQVSEVQPQGISVTAGGSTSVLPAITVRQASTTVQLNDGQSFAIGGLINHNVTEVINAFPGLENLPILGALFRSSSFKSDRSELLMVVTPHIVQPLNQKIALPTEQTTQPSMSEFFLKGQLEGATHEAIVPRGQQ
jgi:pilus assembly protein CpaC